MAEFPPLKPVRRGDKDFLKFTNKDAFPPADWVGALLGVVAVRTVGEQRDAMTTAIVNVVASQHGMMIGPNSKLIATFGDKQEARLKLNDSEPAVRLVRVADKEVTYIDQDDNPGQPARAIFDAPNHHRVVNDPNELLKPVEEQLGKDLVRVLTDRLDRTNPEFELRQRLVDRGIVL